MVVIADFKSLPARRVYGGSLNGKGGEKVANASVAGTILVENSVATT
jgi:hypothetical protein